MDNFQFVRHSPFVHFFPLLKVIKACWNGDMIGDKILSMMGNLRDRVIIR